MTDLRDLLGDAELEPGERARLERVHALLERAGPPPELPPALARSPEPPAARVVPFPKRYRFTALAAAALLAAALFGAGYFAGGGPDEQPVRTVVMTGAGEARAELDVFASDAAGNRPMELRAEGLADGTYELWVTREGELAESCGVFAVATGEETTVPLNAPFDFRGIDGWVVTRAGDDRHVLTT
jgi:hypothetical protein